MDHELDQINVVPLVDVMLVLLVIVLTTATFISTNQIPVDLAKSKHATAVLKKSLIITLQSDGNVSLNQQAIAIDALDVALESYDRETPVIVSADRAIQLERFVRLVDAIRDAGFTQISLKVEQT